MYIYIYHIQYRCTRATPWGRRGPVWNGRVERPFFVWRVPTWAKPTMSGKFTIYTELVEDFPSFYPNGSERTDALTLILLQRPNWVHGTVYGGTLETWNVYVWVHLYISARNTERERLVQLTNSTCWPVAFSNVDWLRSALLDLLIILHFRFLSFRVDCRRSL